jgi:hypothetical protein
MGELACSESSQLTWYMILVKLTGKQRELASIASNTTSQSKAQVTSTRCVGELPNRDILQAGTPLFHLHCHCLRLVTLSSLSQAQATSTRRVGELPNRDILPAGTLLLSLAHCFRLVTLSSRKHNHAHAACGGVTNHDVSGKNSTLLLCIASLFPVKLRSFCSVPIQRQGEIQRWQAPSSMSL